MPHIRTRKPQRTVVGYPYIVETVAHDRFVRGRSFTHEDVRHIIDIFITEIKTFLATYEEVYIRGFGRFYRIFKKARNIRNPQTKEIMLIPGRFEVRFNMASDLKRHLGNKAIYSMTHEHARLALERKNSTVAGQKRIKVKKVFEIDL